MCTACLYKHCFAELERKEGAGSKHDPAVKMDTITYARFLFFKWLPVLPRIYFVI